MRLHRTSVLILLLVLATSLTGFGLAREARDDNERRLLNLQAGEIASLFSSIGTQYQTTVSTTTALVQGDGGDASAFTTYVSAVQHTQGGNWYLLHRDLSGFSVRSAVGDPSASPSVLANRSPGTDALLDKAFNGDFVVLGLFGSGVSRTVALAGGAPQSPGDDVTYVEFPLLAAAASSSSSSAPQSQTITDLDIAVYVGDPAPENLLFATTPNMHGHRATQILSIGNAKVAVEVAAKTPLSGSITSNLPWILLIGGLLCGMLVFLATELTQRRRDLALAVASQLTEKNDELDAALDARTTLEAELRESREELVQRLAWAADFKDPETASHLKRMSRFCELLGGLAGLSDSRCEDLRLAAPMHDIGKIGIPDEILTKPGKYTPEDRAVMQHHPTIGFQILDGSRSDLVQLAADISLNHHEWYDGSGYPNGTRGDSIPIEARIVAIADVFDALTTRRRYKPAMSVDDAFATMLSEDGHFDPRLLLMFMNARDEIEAIRTEFSDGEDSPAVVERVLSSAP